MPVICKLVKIRNITKTKSTPLQYRNYSQIRNLPLPNQIVNVSILCIHDNNDSIDKGVKEVQEVQSCYPQGITATTTTKTADPAQVGFHIKAAITYSRSRSTIGVMRFALFRNGKRWSPHAVIT